MRTVGILTVLAVALVVSAAAGILVGAVAIGPSDVFAALFGSNDVNGTIIRELRLPRVLGAALVGGALATAGALLQGLLRNPLADPFVTGTSARSEENTSELQSLRHLVCRLLLEKNKKEGGTRY